MTTHQDSEQTMTTPDIEQLRKLAEAATPGVWQKSGVIGTVHEKCQMVGPDMFPIAAIPVGHTDKEYMGALHDAQYIAAANPQAISDLHDKARQYLQVILSASENIIHPNNDNPQECCESLGRAVKKLDDLLHFIKPQTAIAPERLAEIRERHDEDENRDPEYCHRWRDVDQVNESLRAAHADRAELLTALSGGLDRDAVIEECAQTVEANWSGYITRVYAKSIRSLKSKVTTS